jgi:hypothetical protein
LAAKVTGMAGKSEKWTVFITGKAQKQYAQLPPDISSSFAVLAAELETDGPARANWRNYGRLKGKKGEYHHCHLNSGKPRYVAVWMVADREVRLMEIRYVGTHEKAPYRHIR